MAEQTFRSPGFFEQELDLSGRTTVVEGTPAGVIGTAERGPAFVPVTVGSFNSFVQNFGGLDAERFAPYAVQKWLDNRTALTFTRVLGAGANSTSTDIQNTIAYGTVKNAGFVISGSAADSSGDTYNRAPGVVKFLAATHQVRPEETMGFPVFTDNDSFNLSNAENPAETVNLVRAMLMFPTGTNAYVAPIEYGFSSFTGGAALTLNDSSVASAAGDFMLVISSSAPVFTNPAGQEGGNNQLRIYSASLNPTSENYISKILNTDPKKFQEAQHLLYADFAVEDELATVASQPVGILSGNLNAGAVSAPGLNVGNKYQDLFGRFDARYKTPRTPEFISQPFGDREYDLFHFETRDDGAYANTQFKVSIANLVASTDPSNKFGNFDVQVRRFSDTDLRPEIVETFPNCNLDPASERYIARVIGDKKVTYDFDAEVEEDRNLIISGKYPNVSRYVRVVMNQEVENEDVPQESLPFGFRGVPTLKTTDSLTAYSASAGGTLVPLSVGGRTYGSAGTRLFGVFDTSSPAGTQTAVSSSLSASIVPPIPLRFKVTRGATTGTNYEGDPGISERVDNRFYWGVKFERMSETASLAEPVLDPNVSSAPNPLVSSYVKFLGIDKLDTLVTGSGADVFNNNKFSLARVALGPDTDNGTPAGSPTAFTQITGSAKAHMLGAAYIRNGQPKTTVVGGVPQRYVVDTSTTSDAGRVTLATLLASSSAVFNRFTPYAKFTAPFFGGFDGLNILDPDIPLGNDRSTSQDAGGKAGSTADVGLRDNLYDTVNTNPMGAGLQNNSVASIRTAINLNTDPFAVNTNVLAIPGVRDPVVTDYAAEKVKEYSRAIYVMDIPEYGMQNGITSTRLYDDSRLKPDVLETAEQFAGRAIDNNYAATYFPRIKIDDTTNNRRVTVPSSVAALAAYSFNDSVSYPWFAPAGFNRGALGFVTSVDVRLNQEDRNVLQDNRINPIATFPRGGFVIFGQKTLQQTQSALDRVNVRRMLLEVKRQVVQVSRTLLFEQNNDETRARFVDEVTPRLSLIQDQQGIDGFNVVMDDTNNTQLDVEQNRLNGRIVIVPTRAIEYIAIDFIVTNAGVEFA